MSTLLQTIISHFYLFCPIMVLLFVVMQTLLSCNIHRKFLGLFILLPENMTDEQKIRHGIEVVKPVKKPKRYMEKHCTPCGAPLVLGKEKCEYCGTTHNVKSPQEEYLLAKMKAANSHSMFMEAAMYDQQAKYERERNRLFLDKIKHNLFFSDEN